MVGWHHRFNGYEFEQALGVGDGGEGNGNPLQYSCLENPMDRGAYQAPLSMGAWQATVHGVTNWTKLSDFTLTFKHHSVFSALPGTMDDREVLINFRQNVSPQ